MAQLAALAAGGFALSASGQQDAAAPRATAAKKPSELPQLTKMRPKVAAWKAATGSERERLDAELGELDREGKFGAPRVFLGTEDHGALLSLKDKAGKERIRLSVGADDVAQLHFLDGKGRVVASFP